MEKNRTCEQDVHYFVTRLTGETFFSFYTVVVSGRGVISNEIDITTARPLRKTQAARGCTKRTELVFRLAAGSVFVPRAFDRSAIKPDNKCGKTREKYCRRNAVLSQSTCGPFLKRVINQCYTVAALRLSRERH